MILMANVEFNDYTIKVKEAIATLSYQALEEACGELEAQVKRNTAVDTGQTKNAWSHHVVGSTMAGEFRGIVGNPMENAIWEELGTGEYALYGNGRKGGWSYRDEKGVWHFTYGKHPRRALFRAYTALKNRLIKHIQDIFKGGLS